MIRKISSFRARRKENTKSNNSSQKEERTAGLSKALYTDLGLHKGLIGRRGRKV